MATQGEKIERLRVFLADSFETSELERFLKLRGYREVAASVSQNLGLTQYSFSVVEALDQRGLINIQFFDHLARERPRKEAVIRGLRAFWLDADQVGEKLSVGPASITDAFDNRYVHRGPDVYKLCNRTIQFTQFTGFLRTHLRDRPGRPAIVFIPGARWECHDAFIDWLCASPIDEYARSRSGFKGPVHNSGKSTIWPSRGDEPGLQQELLISVFNEFGRWIIEDLSLQALAKMPSVLQKPVVVLRHELPMSRWGRFTKPLIQWYLESWGSLVTDGSIPSFFIFLKISYDVPPRTTWCPFPSHGRFLKKIRMDLEEIRAADASGCGLIVLSDLTPPEEPEVHVWLDSYTDLDQAEKREILAALYRPRDRLPTMSLVQDRLKKLVEKLDERLSYVQR
jgi:hypothetical protein